jgi:hypothetical protein
MATLQWEDKGLQKEVVEVSQQPPSFSETSRQDLVEFAVMPESKTESDGYAITSHPASKKKKGVTISFKDEPEISTFPVFTEMIATREICDEMTMSQKQTMEASRQPPAFSVNIFKDLSSFIEELIDPTCMQESKTVSDRCANTSQRSSTKEKHVSFNDEPEVVTKEKHVSFNDEPEVVTKEKHVSFNDEPEVVTKEKHVSFNDEPEVVTFTILDESAVQVHAVESQAVVAMLQWQDKGWPKKTIEGSQSPPSFSEASRQDLNALMKLAQTQSESCRLC